MQCTKLWTGGGLALDQFGGFVSSLASGQQLPFSRDEPY